jgi:hypothetical protein
MSELREKLNKLIDDLIENIATDSQAQDFLNLLTDIREYTKAQRSLDNMSEEDEKYALTRADKIEKEWRELFGMTKQ